MDINKNEFDYYKAQKYKSYLRVRKNDHYNCHCRRDRNVVSGHWWHVERAGNNTKLKMIRTQSDRVQIGLSNTDIVQKHY